MESLFVTWYNWGIFLGIFVAVAAAIYTFFDSQQLGDPSQGRTPLIVSVIGALLTLPSLYYELTIVRPAANGDLLAAMQAMDQFNWLVNTMWIALIGIVIAAAGAIYYVAQVRQSASNMDMMPTDTQYAPTMTSGPIMSPPPPSMPMPPPPTVAPPPPAPSPPRPPRNPTARQAASPVVPATQPIHQEPPARAWLVVQSGARGGSQYGLRTQSLNTIGRDPKGSDLVIDDETVSREHARVRFEQGRFVIYDLGSTSGTYVNGSSVQRQMLYDDDRISVGNAHLVFKST